MRERGCECEGMLRGDESCMSYCLNSMIQRGENKGWAAVGVLRYNIVKFIFNS